MLPPFNATAARTIGSISFGPEPRLRAPLNSAARAAPGHPPLPSCDASGTSRPAVYREAGAPTSAARSGCSGEGSEDTSARLRAAEDRPKDGLNKAGPAWSRSK